MVDQMNGAVSRMPRGKMDLLAGKGRDRLIALLKRRPPSHALCRQ
jgi:hypothetical protein